MAGIVAVPGAVAAARDHRVLTADMASRRTLRLQFWRDKGVDMTRDEAVHRHHVQFRGRGTTPMVMAHGFGCDQQMWRFISPAFEDSHRLVLFDHLGCGRSDLSAYDPQRHTSVAGYADDVVALIEALDLHDVVFVGHSVSAMIGVLASIQCPERFARLVLIGPSPRYLNDPPDYVGGFELEDIEGLAQMMDRNMVGWADYLSLTVAGGDERSPHADELKASFCASDPDILKRFAAATFLGDNRADLPRVTVPSLVLQIERDAIAPLGVGRYCAEHLAGSTLVVLPTTGHCPHLTHPHETIEAIRRYLAR
jgi:sigma-B regulation protein RsbQ